MADPIMWGDEPYTGLSRDFDMDWLLTPRQQEPYSKGRAYLYFFPDGDTENAIIRLNDGDSWYSLVVHPLTGRVEVRGEKIEVRASEFGDRDEEGNTVAPR